jgi:PAS domain S-box-containing protein
MIETLLDSNIVIIGGGRFCKIFLDTIFSEDLNQKRPVILGVADKNPESPGIAYARELGLFTTDDYKQLFRLKKLDLIIELTKDVDFSELIRKTKPPGVRFVDHFEARAVWDYLQIQSEKTRILKDLQDSKNDFEKVKGLFEQFSNFFLGITRDRNKYSQKIRKALLLSQRAMTQIVEGSTIPTFVIDKDHVVLHWNKACENLTGYPADKIVGTNKHWLPFRPEKQPIMADLILKQVTEAEILKLYGKQWRKSALIEGAYEAEEFFPRIGENGRWLFFTAAPIKSPDGEMIGAIETLWDKTAERQAKESQEHHNRELALKARELAERERTMAQIVNGSTMPTFVIDKDHIVLHWNKACEKLTGYSADKIVGTNKHWLPFRPEKRLLMADIILDQVMEGEIDKLYGKQWRKSALIEGAYEAEEFFPRIGENGRWLFFTAAPIKSPDGEMIGAIETLWDKTEERQAEEARERYMRELATLCSIYTALNASRDITDRVNTAIQETTDILTADAVCIFILEDDDKYILQHSYGYPDDLCQKHRLMGGDSMVFRVAQTKKLTIIDDMSMTDSKEIESLSKEGFKFAAYAPLSDRDAKVFGILRAASKTPVRFTVEEENLLELLANRIGVAIENAMLQEKLQRDAAFQARLIESSINGIVATDDEWKIVTFNPEAERIFGYSGAAVIKKIDARTIYPQELIDTITNTLSRGLIDKELPWQEISIVSKDGEDIPVRFSGTLLFEEGLVIGSVAFFQDLREIKRLEKELLQSERLVAVGQTVAGMAHDIKNLLYGFKGGRYLVNIGFDKNDPEKLKSGWEIIQRNIDRTSELVQDLLSYSKEREPEYETCSPNQTADDICELFVELAKENDIEIIKHFSISIAEVVMDPRTIHRVLSNLISNAIDACIFDEDSNKRHQVKVATAYEDGNIIRFEVEDNGSGMTDDVKAKLFTSFFSTKGAQGTGLGLLVTRKLIEEHQGTLEVTSQAGKGSVFTVRLPFKTVS